jgi:hypothetical protein
MVLSILGPSRKTLVVQGDCLGLPEKRSDLTPFIGSGLMRVGAFGYAAAPG